MVRVAGLLPSAGLLGGRRTAIPASHEQRGRTDKVASSATTLLKRAAAYLVSWTSRPQRSPRGLPGVIIVRKAIEHREVVRAQLCTRHAPLGRAFVGSLSGLVAAAENDKAPPAGRSGHSIVCRATRRQNANQHNAYAGQSTGCAMGEPPVAATKPQRRGAERSGATSWAQPRSGSNAGRRGTWRQAKPAADTPVA